MFANFLNVMEIGIWEKRTVWQLNQGLPFKVMDGLFSGMVPDQFITDLASVPRHFGLYEKFGGRCNRPASSHDYLYRKGAIIEFKKEIVPAYNYPSEVWQWMNEHQSGQYQDFPKIIADWIFKMLILEDGEDYSTAEEMYLAVRVCGESSFNRFEVNDSLPLDRNYCCCG